MEPNKPFIKCDNCQFHQVFLEGLFEFGKHSDTKKGKRKGVTPRLPSFGLPPLFFTFLTCQNFLLLQLN